MARLAVGMVFGLLVGVGLPSGLRASEIESVAEEAGVDPTDLAGAVATTGYAPRKYLELVGELAPLPPPWGIWDLLAECESNGNWAIDTKNGYYGGIQFDLDSWRRAGGTGMPHWASRAEQIRIGRNWQRMVGWGAWPACSRRLGLR